MRIILILLLALPALVRADTESDFRTARDAFSRGDVARLDKAADRLKTTVLEPYITYYRLRMRWSAKDTTPIGEFLARDEESPVVDQFRGEWLKYLGMRGRWEEFAQACPRLVTVEDELASYALLLR
ncbi:MAG: transglycosylase, partial [Gallionellaceae bacterium]|nr:transglycosylase [Gallionellaceae bacterium]